MPSAGGAEAGAQRTALGGRCSAGWARRQRVKASIERVLRREYWPAWLFHAPMAPWVLWLALRHRGLMTFTCCNPGIPCGGGIVGESKKEILDALRESAEWILPAVLIEEGGTGPQRARRALALMEGAGLEFPVILKPDRGERGYAVKLARGEEDLGAYFERVSAGVIVQRYHPGPRECGVFWVRGAGGEGAGENGTREAGNSGGQSAGLHEGAGLSRGCIFSVTRKEFPCVAGDGRRTLEELVLGHPRYRRQAGVFRRRFAAAWSRVLPEGETMRLAIAGNHCQGTLFRDGADLITPALEARIDAIARGFRGKDGNTGGLDFGRFDLRYESDDALRAGRGFAIVEFNGTGSESTNIYDPERSLWWAYSVLARQWKVMFGWGERRRAQGVRGLGLRKLMRMCGVARRARTGPMVSD